MVFNATFNNISDIMCWKKRTTRTIFRTTRATNIFRTTRATNIFRTTRAIFRTTRATNIFRTTRATNIFRKQLGRLFEELMLTLGQIDL
jgi:hypothetical protein